MDLRESRWILVTGSLPAYQKDGVGDYTMQLYRALHDAGVDVELMHQPIQTPAAWYGLFRRIPHSSTVIIQYPCEGYGNSVVPGLASIISGLATRHVHLAVTLHEWAQMHFLRKLSIMPLLVGARDIIFVSATERRAFESSRLRLLGGPRLHTIPIGSNISMHRPTREAVVRKRAHLIGSASRLVVHFGFIYEAKQPQKLLQTVAAMRNFGQPTQLVLVGGFPDDHEVGARRFRAAALSLGIEDNVTQFGYVESAAEVMEIISAADAVVSLYSDGLTARRSSFWAAAQAGVPVVTTAISTPGEFGPIEAAMVPPHFCFVEPSATAEEVARTIAELPDYLPFRFEPLTAASWSEVARTYVSSLSRVA